MSGLTPPKVLSYEGQVAIPFISRTFNPTTSNFQFDVPTIWVNTGAKTAFILLAKPMNVADWVPFGGGSGTVFVFDADSGSAAPVAGIFNIFGGTGIKTNASGNTLTISTQGLGSWNIIGASQTLAVNNGYLCTSGGALSLALPSTSALGDTIRVALNGSTSFTITQGAGQQIVIANSKTTLGATGSIATTGTGDTIEIVCQVANTIWVALSYNGNLTVT